MAKAMIWKRLEGWESTAAQVLARIKHNSAYITQGAISSIACKVRRYALEGGAGTTTGTPAVVVNTSVFDVLQTGSGWTEDNTGWNFTFTVPAASFPAPDHYFVLFTFTPGSGSPFRLCVQGEIQSLRGAV